MTSFLYVSYTTNREERGIIKEVAFKEWPDAKEFASTARTAIRQNPKAFKAWVKIMLHANETLNKRQGGAYGEY